MDQNTYIEQAAAHFLALLTEQLNRQARMSQGSPAKDFSRMERIVIGLIPGDGIGVDVIREAVRSLDKIGEVYGHQFHKVERLVGGCCIDAYGVPIPPETLELCRECDAILFGAAGGPKWDHLPRAQRPESGLAALRRGFNLFCNLRPAKRYPALRENSPLKNEVLDRGLDRTALLSSGTIAGAEVA